MVPISPQDKISGDAEQNSAESANSINMPEMAAKEKKADNVTKKVDSFKIPRKSSGPNSTAGVSSQSDSDDTPLSKLKKKPAPKDSTKSKNDDGKSEKPKTRKPRKSAAKKGDKQPLAASSESSPMSGRQKHILALLGSSSPAPSSDNKKTEQGSSSTPRPVHTEGKVRIAHSAAANNVPISKLTSFGITKTTNKPTGLPDPTVLKDESQPSRKSRISLSTQSNTSCDKQKEKEKSATSSKTVIRKAHQPKKQAQSLKQPVKSRESGAGRESKTKAQSHNDNVDKSNIPSKKTISTKASIQISENKITGKVTETVTGSTQSSSVRTLVPINELNSGSTGGGSKECLLTETAKTSASVTPDNNTHKSVSATPTNKLVTPECEGETSSTGTQSDRDENNVAATEEIVETKQQEPQNRRKETSNLASASSLPTLNPEQVQPSEYKNIQGAGTLIHKVNPVEHYRQDTSDDVIESLDKRAAKTKESAVVTPHGQTNNKTVSESAPDAGNKLVSNRLQTTDSSIKKSPQPPPVSEKLDKHKNLTSTSSIEIQTKSRVTYSRSKKPSSSPPKAMTSGAGIFSSESDNETVTNSNTTNHSSTDPNTDQVPQASTKSLSSPTINSENMILEDDMLIVSTPQIGSSVKTEKLSSKSNDIQKKENTASTRKAPSRVTAGTDTRRSSGRATRAADFFSESDSAVCLAEIVKKSSTEKKRKHSDNKVTISQSDTSSRSDTTNKVTPQNKRRRRDSQPKSTELEEPTRLKDGNEHLLESLSWPTLSQDESINIIDFNLPGFLLDTTSSTTDNSISTDKSKSLSNKISEPELGKEKNKITRKNSGEKQPNKRNRNKSNESNNATSGAGEKDTDSCIMIDDSNNKRRRPQRVITTDEEEPQPQETDQHKKPVKVCKNSADHVKQPNERNRNKSNKSTNVKSGVRADSKSAADGKKDTDSCIMIDDNSSSRRKRPQRVITTDEEEPQPQESVQHKKPEKVSKKTKSSKRKPSLCFFSDSSQESTDDNQIEEEAEKQSDVKDDIKVVPEKVTPNNGDRTSKRKPNKRKKSDSDESPQNNEVVLTVSRKSARKSSDDLGQAANQDDFTADTDEEEAKPVSKRSSRRSRRVPDTPPSSEVGLVKRLGRRSRTQPDRLNVGVGKKSRRVVESDDDSEYEAATEEDSPERKPKEQQSKKKKSRPAKKVQKKVIGSEEEHEELIKCRKCEHEASTVKDMRVHYAVKHRLLFKLSNPEGLDDVKSLRTVSGILGTSGRLTCDNCGVVIKTLGYYKQHKLSCLKQRELQTCDMCGTDVLWLREHRQRCLIKKKKAEEYEETVDSEDGTTVYKKRKTPSPTENEGGGRRKRKAATKAMENIRIIDKDKIDDEDLMYTQPALTLPEDDLIAKWKSQLENGETTLTCGHECCSLELGSLKEITEHYWTCEHNGLGRHTWNCKKCHKKFDSEPAAKKHCKTHRKAGVRSVDADSDDADKDAEVVYKSGDEEEDDDITSGDPSDDDISSEDDDGGDTYSQSRRGGDSRGDKYIGAYSAFPIRCDNLRNNLCKELHNTDTVRLCDLMPDSCHYTTSGSTDISSEGGIKESSSIKFVIGKGEAQQLKLGQSTNHNAGHVVYTGQSISHIRWCPVTKQQEVEILSKDQFAVVVPQQEAERSLNGAYKSAGELTVWRISQLTKKYDTEMDEYIKLTHNFGRIHDLKWCLEGGFVQSQDDGLSRLGLLAVAASDGCVHLVSVPYLGVRWKKDEVISYSIDDDVKLSVAGNNTQCLSVEWQKGEHKYIAAGFTDGSLALWFVEKEISSKTRQPIRVFRPHVSMVTSIAWCPFEPDYFITSSHGWYVWDMKDLSSPYFSPKQVDWCVDLHMKVKWPRMYHAMVSCTDPSFRTPPFSSLSLGYENISSKQRRITATQHFTRDVDICDCSSTLATADVSGKVAYFVPIIPKMSKRSDLSYYKYSALRSAALKSHEEEAEVKFDYAFHKKHKHTDGDPVCVGQGLIDNEIPNAISSVALSPNAGSHGWLLCGGTHGLLHLIKLDKECKN